MTATSQYPCRKPLARNCNGHNESASTAACSKAAEPPAQDGSTMTKPKSIATYFFDTLRQHLLIAVLCSMPLAHAQNAAALQARHASLREALDSNVFQRPVTLESSEQSGMLKGDVYARIEQPFTVVGPALRGMSHWCDLLILHQNIKRCSPSASRNANTLSVHVGRKFDQPLGDTQLFKFDYQVVASKPDYLQVLLKADAGPLGTSDYRIQLEVVALDAQRSFLHLSYSYSYGVTARIAMKGYLATTGRDKVGFSTVGGKTKGKPRYIGGTRGVVERNTMRYYLAIEAYLGALSVAEPLRLEKRLSDWYAGVERYPRQLHELQRGEYLEMKRREIKRQQTP